MRASVADARLLLVLLQTAVVEVEGTSRAALSQCPAGKGGAMRPTDQLRPASDGGKKEATTREIVRMSCVCEVVELEQSDGLGEDAPALKV